MNVKWTRNYGPYAVQVERKCSTVGEAKRLEAYLRCHPQHSDGWRRWTVENVERS